MTMSLPDSIVRSFYLRTTKKAELLILLYPKIFAWSITITALKWLYCNSCHHEIWYYYYTRSEFGKCATQKKMNIASSRWTSLLISVTLPSTWQPSLRSIDVCHVNNAIKDAYSFNVTATIMRGICIIAQIWLYMLYMPPIDLEQKILIPPKELETSSPDAKHWVIFKFNCCSLQRTLLHTLKHKLSLQKNSRMKTNV